MFWLPQRRLSWQRSHFVLGTDRRGQANVFAGRIGRLGIRNEQRNRLRLRMVMSPHLSVEMECKFHK